MSFTNKVRLPIDFNRPQFPVDLATYRFANGDTKTLSAILRKTYEGSTEWLPEQWHEKIRIALVHDSVIFEGERYIGRVVMTNGDYTIQWSEDFRNLAIAPAQFAVDVAPYFVSNNNCMTCDEVSSIVLVDDKFPGVLEPGTSHDLNVIANDSVCCYPVEFSILTINSDLVSAATIDTEGVVHVTIKTGINKTNDAFLLTYRATCSNGFFDDADVTADLDGIAACLAPTHLTVASANYRSAVITFTPPSPAGDHFHWYLQEADGMVIVQTGDSPGSPILLSYDNPDIEYQFFIRTQCEANNDTATASNYVGVQWLAPANSATCGHYRVYGSNTQDADANSTEILSYTDCNGMGRNAVIKNYTQIDLYVLQTSPGAPADPIAGNSPFWKLIITYVP